MPCSETLPIVGFSPVRFCAFDGAVIEPPVCVPTAEVAIRDATAVADPDDEPPGSVVGSFGVHAFTVVIRPSGVVARVVANGPICVLPRTIPPAAVNRRTAVASKGGTKSANRYEFAVVVTPCV